MADTAPRVTVPWAPARTRPFRFGAQENHGDPDPPLAVGAVVDGRYVIAGLLGEGGMGRVYAAEHRVLGRAVALKVLRRDAGADAEGIARFHQEALLASRIGHRGIAQVHDVGRSPEGVIYLAMELLRGESLEEALGRPGPAKERLGWMAAVARALAAAHAAGVVHRDVKPANVFLASDGEGGVVPKLLDFGIAKAVAESGVQTRAGSLLGTPYYLAPERALGRSLDPRADLYSLGVILYEMVTGDIPFADANFMAVLGHHIHTTPLDPRQAAPERPIPDGLAGLVMALLAKDPAARPADGEAVAQALEAIAADPGIAGLELGARAAGAPADSVTQRVALERPTLPITAGEGTVRLPLPEAASSVVVPGVGRPGRGRWIGGVVVAVGIVALAIWGALGRGPAEGVKPAEGSAGVRGGGASAEPVGAAIDAGDSGESEARAPGAGGVSGQESGGAAGAPGGDGGTSGSGEASGPGLGASGEGSRASAPRTTTKRRPTTPRSGGATTSEEAKAPEAKAPAEGGGGPSLKRDVYDE